MGVSDCHAPTAEPIVTNLGQQTHSNKGEKSSHSLTRTYQLQNKKKLECLQKRCNLATLERSEGEGYSDHPVSKVKNKMDPHIHSFVFFVTSKVLETFVQQTTFLTRCGMGGSRWISKPFSDRGPKFDLLHEHLCSKSQRGSGRGESCQTLTRKCVITTCLPHTLGTKTFQKTFRIVNWATLGRRGG